MAIHRSLTRSGSTLFSWSSLGLLVAALMLARWTWILFAPTSTAVPVTTAWEPIPADVSLFGTATDPAHDGSPSNLQLVGVFAHPSRGFAVLMVDGKQVGVGVGNDIRPGLRLVATAEDHVVVAQGGAEMRIALPQRVTAGITAVPDQVITSSAKPVPPAVNDALNELTPQQRGALHQELEHFRRKL
ncbi:MAG: hypothetical protein Fur0040_01870 [Sideroxydans sp.]